MEIDNISKEIDNISITIITLSDLLKQIRNKVLNLNTENTKYEIMLKQIDTISGNLNKIWNYSYSHYDSLRFQQLISFLYKYIKAQNIHEQLEIINRNITLYDDNNPRIILENFSKYLKELINYLPDILNTPEQSYNSKSYYEEQISKIEKQRSSLLDEIEELKNSQMQTTEEREEYRLALSEKEIILQKYQEQIANYKLEKEEIAKRDNAIKDWNKKITDTFKELQISIKPIKNERRLLKYMFYSYAVLSFILVLGLGLIEYLICNKIYANINLITWRDYLHLVPPIPIAIGLLWGFITQLNRAQRQMIILAKHIHEIEYVQGLLLTLNSLSMNIEDSMTKVNKVIDKLVENHLIYKSEPLRDEISLKDEEKKDNGSIPYDTLIKLIKELRG